MPVTYQFPAHLECVPLAQRLWMHHIHRKSRGQFIREMEEIRKQLVDDCEHESAADGQWNHLLAFQHSLTIAAVVSPDAYAVEIEAMRQREIQWFVSQATLDELAAKADGGVYRCADAVREVLGRYGVLQDPQWRAKLAEVEQTDKDLNAERQRALYASEE